MLDDVDEERFQRLRYVELKHGRICQLAFLGQIVTRAGIHLNGDIDLDGHSFDSYPNGLAAVFGPDAIPALGLVQIIGFIGVLETVTELIKPHYTKAGKEPYPPMIKPRKGYFNSAILEGELCLGLRLGLSLSPARIHAHLALTA